MLKIILVSSLVSASFVTTTFVATGRVHYSGLQIQQPLGFAFKMTPDPSNIWSCHEEITPTKPQKSQSFPIVVDFDNNGKMDTEYKGVRVMITDIQIIGGANVEFDIADSAGKRWNLPSFSHNNRVFYEKSFTTPLVLPVGSELKIEAVWPNNPSRFIVNIIGRLVTL